MKALEHAQDSDFDSAVQIIGQSHSAHLTILVH